MTNSSSGAYTLSGGAGVDNLTGGSGADILTGAGGNDVLIGGIGGVGCLLFFLLFPYFSGGV